MQLLKPSWINHDGDKAIFGVDIHPDGTRFATGGQGQDSSGRVVIWNLNPVISEKAEQNNKVPKLLCQLDQHLGCVNSVRWSNSGNFLASAGDDKVIIIWKQSGYGGGTVFGSNVVNVESWRIVSTLRGHEGDILDVAWSPQDIWLASASVDNTVIIWNASKWPEQVCILRGHTGMVKGVTWDPSGRYLASQADDKSMRIWRTSSWATEEKIVDPFTECGGTTTILRPAWSPDGQYLVSAHAMNNGGPTAQIIERDGWNAEKDFVGHRKAVTCVRFNPNILVKENAKSSKIIPYCCLAIGSRDRSVSIWFTSLKRPLVVVHDIFEDSVLDLAWSKCGKYLMAVSKDGTLGFISFSETEIGRAFTDEQTMKYHIQLYGSCDISAATTASSVIENPEILRLQEEKKKNENNLQKKSVDEKRVVTPTGPTNKQIEMRTADGRRRITPMFIPPPPGGESSCKTVEDEEFSTSRQEKSKIIIEKVDGIVEPNVSSPSKSTKSSQNSSDLSKVNSAAATAAVADLEAIPSLLSARIEGHSDGQYIDKTPSTIQVKRKNDEPYGALMKRKRGRGRPPLYSTEKEKSDVGTGGSSYNSSRPPSPASMQIEPRHHTRAPDNTGTVQVMQRDVLPPASMPRISKVQISGIAALNGGMAMLILEKDWRMSDNITTGVGGKVPSLHRVSRCDSGTNVWATYLASEFTAACGAISGVAIACKDGSLHMLNCENGEYSLPPIQLTGRPSQLLVQESYVVALTTDANLSIWDFAKGKKILMESVRHLVENRGGVKCVQMIGEPGAKNPVVILKSGEAFSWFSDLESWIQLGESIGVRRFINPEFSLLQSFPASSFQNPLSGILAASGAYSGTTRLSVSSASGEVRRGLTESFLKRMVTSSKHLASCSDFKFWHKRLAKFYISEGMEKDLRKIFDDLLGPLSLLNNPSELKASDDQRWDNKIMGLDKHELLEEYLKEILLAENSIQFQRLHSEYSDQLKGMDTDAI